MSELSKQALKVDNNQSFPNNNNGAITPSILRAFNVNMIDSNVNQTDFDTFSGSVATQFANATGSVTSAITASSLITASFDNGTRNLTFTKGDASTFAVNIPDVSGSTLNTGSLTTTASFNAYTQSNDQRVSSLEATSASLLIETQNLELFSASVLTSLSNLNTATQSLFTSTSLSITTASVSGTTMTFTKGNGTTFNVTLPTGSGGGTIDTGSFATTGSNFFVGVEAINSIPGTNVGEVYLLGRSGSLILGNSVSTPTYAALSHLSSSQLNGNTNIIFKSNSNTGTTIISGSNNIFTNPSNPASGYIKYIGGSNNIYLNNGSGINSEITASATSVSGNRPIMNNNIFQGTSAFNINQAVNGGAHTYSNNLFGAANNVNINALAFTGSTFTISDNIFKGGLVTINPASASLAEIAAGVSGSGGGGVEILRNMIIGTGTLNISVGPKFVTGFNSFIGNIINAGALTITNISSSFSVNATNNISAQAQTYTNAGAANLGIHRQAGTMNGNYGGMNLIASASAISATTNISTQPLTVTNRMYSGSVIGSGSLLYTNNINNGGQNTYTITGSFGGTGFLGMSNNGVIGSSNTIFTNVESRGNYVGFLSNVVGGQNLILTGSNNNAITASGGGYFGRFNADDGIRNQTAENIFFVGTGTSASNRKTGFLIDSGSNTFVEGTLNVSGSTIFSSSFYIQSASANLPNTTGSAVLTYNPTTGQVGQASYVSLVSASFDVGGFQTNVTYSGSASVSQSVNFEITDVSKGISIQNNSQIRVNNPGTYLLVFSAQLDCSTGADTIWMWLKKNGTNLAESTTKARMANNTSQVIAVNFMLELAANDYIELVWENLNGHGQLLAEGASGNYPAIPAVILTINQVH